MKVIITDLRSSDSCVYELDDEYYASVIDAFKSFYDNQDGGNIKLAKKGSVVFIPENVLRNSIIEVRKES